MTKSNNTYVNNQEDKTMNNNISKETFIKLVKEFKNFVNDKGNKPYIDNFGVKVRPVKAEHFYFYALLRNKDPMLGLTSCKIETKIDVETSIIACITKSHYGISSLKKAFPSIDEELICKIASKAELSISIN